MKTQVLVKQSFLGATIKDGETGYIDGYVITHDTELRAIVVSGKNIEMFNPARLEVVE